MTMDNLINLIAAILVGGGTLFLGIMALRTIRQTRSIQRAEKRERLLNEIIEWAIDISKCGIEKGYPDISNLIDLHTVWLKISNNIDDIILCFKEMRGKNQYIGEIVKTLPQDLQEASQTLIGDFEEHIRLLSLCETYMRDREETWKETVGHKHKLNFSAKKVIEEVCKIKVNPL